jgi:hypothetical protein
MSHISVAEHKSRQTDFESWPIDLIDKLYEADAELKSKNMGLAKAIVMLAGELDEVDKELANRIGCFVALFVAQETAATAKVAGKRGARRS